MTAQTLSLTPNSSTTNTVTLFRAWGSAISAAIAANGQVQTADTGQVNWATVALPATNTAGGYEIWRFNDSLQSGAPVYFKLEYGINTASAPQMWVTIGTASDGAGNITGAVTGVLTPQVAPRISISGSGGSSTSVATTSYVNGDAGCLAMFLFPNNNSSGGWAGFMLLIERTRDATGNATGDGVLCVYAFSNSSAVANASCLLTFLPGVRASSPNLSWTGTWPLVSVNSGVGYTLQTCVINGVLYPLQVYTSSGPKAGGPSQYVMAVCLGDIAANQVVAITHYGTSRNWYTAGLGYALNASGWGILGASDLATNLKSFLFRVS